LLASIAVLIGVLELRRPLVIEPASSIPFLIACAPVVAVALCYTYLRPRQNFAVMAITLSQMLVFSMMGCVLQYLLAREGGPMWDATLSGCDKALGVDWLSLVRTVDAHPVVAWTLGKAYQAMIPEAIAVILILGVLNRLDQLRVFLLAGMLCGAIIIILSPLFPSVSSYVFLGLTQADFKHVNVVPGYSQLADFEALRRGTFTVIHLPQLQGIIAFPSYHAGLATTNAWGFWNSRIEWLRWPGMLLAAATIISAPVFGGHYVVDVLGGIAIAVCSIIAAKRLAYWRGITLPLKASLSGHSEEAFAP